MNLLTAEHWYSKAQVMLRCHRHPWSNWPGRLGIACTQPRPVPLRGRGDLNSPHRGLCVEAQRQRGRTLQILLVNVTIILQMCARALWAGGKEGPGPPGAQRTPRAQPTRRMFTNFSPLASSSMYFSGSTGIHSREAHAGAPGRRYGLCISKWRCAPAGHPSHRAEEFQSRPYGAHGAHKEGG